MNNSPKKEKSLDILCEEYVRLRTRYEALVDSSFGDFQYLAAIGGLIAWPPLATSDIFQAADTGLRLLVGFIGILFLIGILATRDMVKWSIIEFYLQEMLNCERAIKLLLKPDIQVFHFAHNWPKHYREHYVPVFIRFTLLFVLLLLFFPVGVLYLRGEYSYVVVYLVGFASVIGIYLSAAKKLGAV